MPRSRSVPVFARTPALVALAALLLGPWAHARPSAAPAMIDDVEHGVELTSQAARGLESVLGPAGGRLLESEALKRFQDAVYLNLVGEYQAAAEQFFVLVTTRSLESLALDGDAEWYLAESLFGMGSFDVAESRYLTISAIQGHPFRKDAVRRLLEIYAKDADPARFERLYLAEVATGLIAADDMILYGIAKAFWSRGETGRAKSYFSEIKQGSPYWSRAQYFLGAMIVAPGDPSALDAAEPVFRALAELPPGTAEDRVVHDLGLLALARIQFERGNLEEAIQTYQRVPDDSASRSDKLHELAWTFIKLGRLKEAVTAVDAFLAAYPQHPYAAELNLVRGHLLFETGDYEEAHGAYDKVVAEYAPIRDRFQRLARSNDRSEAWVKQVMAMESGVGDGGSEALPGYAVSLLQADPDLSRAIALFRELAGQDASLGASESLIQQIGEAVGSTEDDAEGLRVLHVSAGVAYAEGLARYADLLDAERAWLKTAGSGAADPTLATLGDRVKGVREAVVRLREKMEDVRSKAALGRGAAAVATRAEIEQRLASVRAELAALPPTASPADRVELELRVAEQERVLGSLTTPEQADAAIGRIPAMMKEGEGWADELDAIAKELVGLRAPLAIDVVMDPTVARFESIHRSLDVALERLLRSEAMLAVGSESHLYRVREVLKREIEAVKAERGDLTTRYGEAEGVAGGIVRSNLEKLAARFAASVLGADMGVVNVYWSELVKMSDEVEAVGAERAAKLQDLDRRYGYLEQKVGGRKP